MTTICTRCVYDSNTPKITFNEDGICNYCQMHDDLCAQYPSGEEGQKHIQAMADEVSKAGKGKKYDCIVGVSGGCDSSYLVHIVKEVMGLRPLAVHFNNTWNSQIAEDNMHKVLNKLNVDLYTYTVDAKEYDDIYRSFFKSGTPDIDVSTDIALAATLNNAAEKYDIKYTFEGHNFRTEGVAPLGWVYMDGKYIQSVHKQFGTMPLKTYPNMLLSDMLRWMIMRNIRKFRPLWYMDYNKEKIKQFLHETYDWQWYGGHHLENRFTAFFHSYFMPKRYNTDCRKLGYAANVRTQKMSRTEALALLEEPHHLEEGLLDYLKTRLHLTDEEFELFMTQPKKTFRDYPNYKKTFERMRPFFWLMAKVHRIPMSFYLKYAKKFE